MRQEPGNNLDLGTLVNRNNTLPFDAKDRATHLYVCGATGTGKSKFLEHLIRQDIINWSKSKCGLLLLDPHGSLYDNLMMWLARHDAKRPVIPIDLSRKDWVVGYNLLKKRKETDPAVLVSNFVQAMAFVWGASGTDKTPLFARWASNVLRALYENELTLLESELLLDHTRKRGREYLITKLPEGSTKRDWFFANSLSPEKFEDQAGSTINRLHRFLETKALRNMFGQSEASLDLDRCLEEGSIVLVSLATRGGQISDEDGALFATLLLSDLWTAARERGKGTARNPKPFYVYVDEFQNFVTPTIAKNLDQARGFGLHLTLAHQFPNQLLHTGAHGKEVYDSVFVNARSKVVFSMGGEENLRPLAEALFRGVMDPDKVKHEIHSTKVMDYVEEYRKTYARGESHGFGGGSQLGEASGRGSGSTASTGSESDSKSKFASTSSSYQSSWSDGYSESETDVPILKPVLGKELSHIQFESLDEQLFRAMAVLFDQKQRQAVARVVGVNAPVSIFTPVISSPPLREGRLEMYVEKRLNQIPFAIRTEEAKKRIAERGKRLQQESERVSEPDEPSVSKRRIRA